MLQIKQKLIILAFGISISLNTLAAENPKSKTIDKPITTCDSVIKACDKALEEKNNVIKLSDLALTKSREDNTRLNKEVEDSNGKLSAWYRSPLVLIGIGLLGGALLFK